MQISIEEFKGAVELLAVAGGAEVEIVAQFVLDLAVSSRFNTENEPLTKDEVLRLLSMRIARHRAANHPTSDTIH